MQGWLQYIMQIMAFYWLLANVWSNFISLGAKLFKIYWREGKSLPAFVLLLLLFSALTVVIFQDNERRPRIASKQIRQYWHSLSKTHRPATHPHMHKREKPCSQINSQHTHTPTHPHNAHLHDLIYTSDSSQRLYLNFQLHTAHCTVAGRQMLRCNIIK